MTVDQLAAYAGFVLATAITPGPNNAMLLASGVNFGLRRSVWHLVGICAGCTLMLLLVGLGLGQVFAAAPALYDVLRYVGALYLLWLAWHIAVADAERDGRRRGRPMRFIEAVSFQWINPKAWIIVVGAVTTYAPRMHFLTNVVVLGLLWPVIAFPCMTLWAACGVALRRLLDHPARRRAFNVAMALLLVASLYPLLHE